MLQQGNGYAPILSIRLYSEFFFKKKMSISIKAGVIVLSNKSHIKLMQNGVLPLGGFDVKRDMLVEQFEEITCRV